MIEADEKLFEVWRQFDFNIDPINIEIEKQRFLKNKDYNPKFEYLKELKLNQFMKNLENIKHDDSWIGKLIKKRTRYILKKIEMLSNKENENFTKNSITVFGKPNKNLLELANKELKLKDEIEIKNLSDKDARKIIFRALSENNLKNWQIQIRRDMGAISKVDAADRIIYIKKGEKFSLAGIERLIVHELQSHAFRMENSQLQKYKLFQVGFPNYLETEEGLAAFNEERTEYLLHNKIRRLYAGRVIAVDLALKNGFADVFAELTKFFSDEDAWDLTVRVKRGLQNTSQPGAFTKDYLYSSGKIKVKEFLRSKGNILDLYIGRIGVSHIPVIKENNNIKPASWIPNNMNKHS